MSSEKVKNYVNASSYSEKEVLINNQNQSKTRKKIRIENLHFLQLKAHSAKLYQN